jgi:serine O-acetyltransferase
MIDDRFVDDLLTARQQQTRALPDRQRLHQFTEDLVVLLFPQFGGSPAEATEAAIRGAINRVADDLRRLLTPGPLHRGGASPDSHASLDAEAVVSQLFASLPEIYRVLWLDAQAVYDGDPAAESLDEVIAAYPGFFAIYGHRIAHNLYEQRVPVLPRLLAEYAHRRTGIDIHPGARIGERFCIDHGTGIVIGETAEVGTAVKVYQGVSLGALSVAKEMAGTKRHPTIEDNVVIYSNATILGGRTVIGHDSVIGGNVWLTESVAPYSVVQHHSEVRVRPRRTEHQPIDFVI